tara:strand:- start:2260 stop:2931 length:672 start_codon:yes stop_codon:yes gene_type:complete
MKLLKINTIVLLMFFISILGCEKKRSSKTHKLNHNKELAEELIDMATIDQIAAGPFKRDDFATYEKYKTFKDSVFRVNKIKLEKIFNQYNYPGIDLVGKDGETSFWVMTQHSDFDTIFQNKILIALKKQVKKGNAKPAHLALLTDRILLNRKEKQVYGTQVSYNKQGQAFSVFLKDSINVDYKRQEVGLKPLKNYLNQMTTSHFNMNKENFTKRGVFRPNLYK